MLAPIGPPPPAHTGLWPNWGKTNFGQIQLWPNQVWPKLLIPHSLLSLPPPPPPAHTATRSGRGQLRHIRFRPVFFRLQPNSGIWNCDGKKEKKKRATKMVSAARKNCGLVCHPIQKIRGCFIFKPFACVVLSYYGKYTLSSFRVPPSSWGGHCSPRHITAHHRGILSGRGKRSRHCQRSRLPPDRCFACTWVH